MDDSMGTKATTSKLKTARSEFRLRHVFGGRTKWILLIVLVVLVAFRIALPTIVKSYVNKTLADIPGYPGYIDDVDMDLWRGAYVIKDLNIEKVDAKIPVPFFSSKKIDLSIEWAALLQGSLLGKIKFIDPKNSFVQGPTEVESQNGGGTNFIETLKKLFPVKINRFDVQNGEVHFRNFHSNPKVDIHLDSLFLHASNLTNSKSLSKTLVASVDARGKVMGTGRLKGHLDIDPYAAQPTFKLDCQVEQVELTTMNNFFDAYGSIDVKSGVFQMYSEVAAADGKFTGYVKPLFKDMIILDVSKDAKNPLKLIWQALVAGVAALFTNHSTDVIGTTIPLSGTFENKTVDILSTLGGILKNAFIKALLPGIDRTISLKEVRAK
jgi:hypothetical protein